MLPVTGNHSIFDVGWWANFRTILKIFLKFVHQGAMLCSNCRQLRVFDSLSVSQMRAVRYHRESNGYTLYSIDTVLSYFSVSVSTSMLLRWNALTVKLNFGKEDSKWCRQTVLYILITCRCCRRRNRIDSGNFRMGYSIRKFCSHWL